MVSGERTHSLRMNNNRDQADPLFPRLLSVNMYIVSNSRAYVITASTASFAANPEYLRVIPTLSAEIENLRWRPELPVLNFRNGSRRLDDKCVTKCRLSN